METENTMVLEENTPVQTGSFVKAVIICGIASLFYLYEFILQVSPNVMTHDLMHDLKIDAAGLGIISMFYYCSYTPMQIPAGLLFDRFSTRSLLSFAIGICSVGAILFGFTHGMFLASVGRFCMGIGSAFAFIGALVLIARWFEPKYFAVMAGMVQLLSSVGAILGETPLAMASHAFGWRQTMIAIGVFGMFLMVFTYIFIRDYPAHAPKEEKTRNDSGNVLANLKHVCKVPQNWWIACYAFFDWAAVLVFAALWGTPYLAEYYHVNDSVAASFIIMIWVGIGIASPVLGWYSDRIMKRRGPLLYAALLGLIASCIMLYVPNVPMWLMYIIMFCIGAAAGGQSLAFGFVRDINRPKYVGTAIGFTNMAVVFSGWVFQPIVGFLLRMHWDGAKHLGTPVYSTANFSTAFIILPVSFLIALLVIWLKLHETDCKPHYED